MKKPRYIDANKIKLTGLTFSDVNNEVYFSLTDIRKAIEQTPTADVVEVRHGEWKPLMTICNRGECSECYEIGAVRWKYCPNCGAKMYGERKEQE